MNSVYQTDSITVDVLNDHIVCKLIKQAQGDIRESENFKLETALTLDQFYEIWKGNGDHLSKVFADEAIGQGVSKHVVGSYFQEFQVRIHDMVEKMMSCEDCATEKECKEHVFEYKNQLEALEHSSKVKELITR